MIAKGGAIETIGPYAGLLAMPALVALLVLLVPGFSMILMLEIGLLLLGLGRSRRAVGTLQSLGRRRPRLAAVELVLGARQPVHPHDIELPGLGRFALQRPAPEAR